MLFRSSGVWRCGKQRTFSTSPHPRRRLRTNVEQGVTLTLHLVQKIGPVNLFMNKGENKQLKVDLCDFLSSQMSCEGFKFAASKLMFVRKHESTGITDRFQLVFLDAKPGWEIRPDVGMRFDRVEEIFHRTSGFERQYQKGTSTIGNSVGEYTSNRGSACEFRLESHDEVVPVAEKILEVFRRFALPYFEKYASLRVIDAELNDRPTERTPHRLTIFRCPTGLIVAKLSGRPNYRQLVEIYTEIMSREDRGFYLKRFQDLVKSLESVEPESDPIVIQ